MIIALLDDPVIGGELSFSTTPFTSTPGTFTDAQGILTISLPSIYGDIAASSPGVCSSFTDAGRSCRLFKDASWFGTLPFLREVCKHVSEKVELFSRMRVSAIIHDFPRNISAKIHRYGKMPRFVFSNSYISGALKCMVKFVFVYHRLFTFAAVYNKCGCFTQNSTMLRIGSTHYDIQTRLPLPTLFRGGRKSGMSSSG